MSKFEITAMGIQITEPLTLNCATLAFVRSRADKSLAGFKELPYPAIQDFQTSTKSHTIQRDAFPSLQSQQASQAQRNWCKERRHPTLNFRLRVVYLPCPASCASEFWNIQTSLRPGKKSTGAATQATGPNAWLFIRAARIRMGCDAVQPCTMAAMSSIAGRPLSSSSRQP